MTPEPPAALPPPNRTRLPAGTVLHRIHSRARGPLGFNPCLGRPSRFAPIRNTEGDCIPTAYAATSYECAAHETVFHEIQHDAPRKSIPLDDIKDSDYATVATRRVFVLAALFEPDLNRWRLTRRDLIDTYPSAYATTARWAAAIHAVDPALDGMIWTSRRCDPERAAVLFGDRVAESDLEERSRVAILDSEARLAELREFAARAGIFFSM